MNVLRLAKDSLRTLWRNKKLWIFGVFASGVGGSFSEEAGQPPSTTLLVVLAILAVVFFVATVVSEGALIEGVRRAHRGEPTRLKELAGVGLHRFWRVFAIQASFAVATMAAFAVAAGPAVVSVLVADSVTVIVVGITLTMALLVLLVPVVLTLALVKEWALRSAVLEDTGVVEAIAAGARFLRGRLAVSLKLVVVDALAQAAAGVAGALLALPGILVGGLVFLATDAIVASIVSGAVLVVPFALAVAGARGTFRSSLWTLGFLSQRPSLGA